MKKKTLIIEDDIQNKVKERKKRNIPVKLIITIVLLILCTVNIVYILKIYYANKEFAENVSELSKLNARTIFSIDRMYLYSSADATSKETTKPIWDLDIYQFTDIALYINNRDEEGITYENTIKSLTIDDIKFNNLKSGNPKLYYKNVNEFAKLEIKDENEIKENLSFNIINSGDADYSNPVLYSNCQNPITLEYVNSNMKEETKISDITTPLTYDGSLLKKGGILLSQMKCTISFKITIINYYNQKFISTVYIDIPLEDTLNNTSIYDGKMIKNIENTNMFKFIRVE